MKLYISYQVEGGRDEWVPAHASTPLDDVKPAFVTVLACDKLLNKSSPKELVESAKYLGPLYFDLDQEGDLQSAVQDGNELIQKLKGLGLQEDDFEIYLSGKKGIHIIIPPEVFIEKPTPVAKLPAIYKELAFKFAVPSTDFAVYSGRSGRMFRTCYRQRENGNWKVRVTSSELLLMTEASYNLFCSKPTRKWESKPTYRANLALAFEEVAGKIHSQKKVKTKPVDAATLRRHLPTVQRVMRGENLKDGVGFNKIAIQLALYAQEAKLTADQLIEASAGLVNNHAGDGYRYNTPFKREQELRRMFDYLEGGVGYDYAIGPIMGLLGPDPIPEEDEKAEGNVTLPFEAVEDTSGLFTKGANYFIGTEQGDKHVMDGIFTDPECLLSMEQGDNASLLCIQVKLKTATKTFIITVERSDMASSNSLHRAVSAFGVSFTGTDIHARYIFSSMVTESKINGKTVYVTQKEGLDVLTLPFAGEDGAREPFLVWTDKYGVSLPKHLEEQGLDVRFVGFPSPEGVVKTDLAAAPKWPEWVAEGNNRQIALDALDGFLSCQEPGSIAKFLGWMTACFYTQLFRSVYHKFPILHINGAAGSGKSEMTETLMHLFYNKGEPPVLSPSSTVFAIGAAISSTASIPIIVDEYKPSEMSAAQHSAIKSMFRSSYNGHTISKGGGNRTKENFGAINQVQLLGPVVFISESMEQETALLERCVVLTLRRATGRVAGRQYANFQKMAQNKAVLSVIGYFMASHIVTSYSTERLQEEFSTLHEAALVAHTLQAGDAETLSADEIARKTNSRPRVIYGHTVAQFGIKKFRATIEFLLPEMKETHKDLFDRLEEAVFDRMGDVTNSTVAEYLKILITMSDMSRFKDTDPYKLEYGYDYQQDAIGGKDVITIAGRRCYSKYMAYCRSIGTQPLFMSDMPFVHALRDSPMFVMNGFGTKNLQQDTVQLDYESLQRSGCPIWASK